MAPSKCSRWEGSGYAEARVGSVAAVAIAEEIGRKDDYGRVETDDAARGGGDRGIDLSDHPADRSTN